MLHSVSGLVNGASQGEFVVPNENEQLNRCTRPFKAS